MKNILYIFILASILSSCVKLDEEPKSQISSTNFYRTTSDGVSAVQSIYFDLTHNTSGDHASIYNRLLVLAVGMGTDDNVPGVRATNPDVRSIAAYTQSATNTRYYELWRQHYEAINRANAAIDNLPNIKGDTAVLNRLTLEARFLRGLLYYNLVRLWGPVPLTVHATSSVSGLNIPRSDTAAVYQQIVSDFTAAKGLPIKYTGADAFRATSGAAKAFLLSVAITRRQWSNAVSIYNSIVSGGHGYALSSNYADVFSSTKKFTAEHIFDANYVADGTVTFNGTGNGNILGYIAAPVNGYVAGGGLGADADAPILPLRKLFISIDKRASATFTDTILAANSAGKIVKSYNPHFTKFLDPSSGVNLLNNGINFPIIRYAEVLLFNAEAQNELGNSTEAYKSINLVRNRAGLPNLTAGLSKDNFRDSVFFERKLEFVYEQIRWFDLIRTNGSGTKLFAKALKALDPNGTSGTLGSPNYDAAGWVQAKSKVTDEHFTLLPIPASELQANPALIQNPNW